MDDFYDRLMDYHICNSGPLIDVFESILGPVRISSHKLMGMDKSAAYKMVIDAIILSDLDSDERLYYLSLVPVDV